MIRCVLFNYWKMKYMMTIKKYIFNDESTLLENKIKWMKKKMAKSI